jgi:RNA polymerase sigma-70 factor (ECF subfamily)
LDRLDAADALEAGEGRAMAADTLELLQRFRAGDQAAYGVLFQRYRPDLQRFIDGHMAGGLRGVLSAEDVLQETHLEALRCLDGFTYRRELSFYFWLCGIARNRIHHHCRRLQRRPPPLSLSRPVAGASTSSQDLLARLQSARPGPADLAQLHQHLHVLAAALDSLPPAQRQAVLLRYVEGHDNAQAAVLAGVQPGAFRVRLTRALLRLREALAELLGEARPA